MATEKKKKKPWELTPSEVDDLCTKAIQDRHNIHDGEAARFKRGEGMREIEDDSALGDLPPPKKGSR